MYNLNEQITNFQFQFIAKFITQHIGRHIFCLEGLAQLTSLESNLTASTQVIYVNFIFIHTSFSKYSIQT